MKRNIPWTKTLLEDFISEALLTEDEEQILRTRVSGWSIVKQSMEFNMSTATVSRIIKHVNNKYDNLHRQNPSKYPQRKISKYEEALNNTDINKEHVCEEVFKNLKHHCGKNVHDMTAEEIIACQKSCPHHSFYQ